MYGYPSNNPYVDTIVRRHEARKRFLPRLGIPVADKPTEFLLLQAEECGRIAQALARKKTPVRTNFVGLSERGLMEYVLSHPISGGGSRPSYLIYNAACTPAAAPVKQPTGTAIRTMMQLVPATNFLMKVIEWGFSFDGSSAATPGQVELIETGTVAATSLSTAYVANDIQPFSDPTATANTAGTSGVPFNLGTSLSGFSTAAVTEGSVVAPSRQGDIVLAPPTGPYVKQSPLDREFAFGYWSAAQHYLRVRATFGTTVNMTAYVIVE